MKRLKATKVPLNARYRDKPQDAVITLKAEVRLGEGVGGPASGSCGPRDLARLLADRGERQQAVDFLAPIHGSFTEGFDLPDLEESKSLLDGLRV